MQAVCGGCNYDSVPFRATRLQYVMSYRIITAINDAVAGMSLIESLTVLHNLHTPHSAINAGIRQQPRATVAQVANISFALVAVKSYHRNIYLLRGTVLYGHNAQIHLLIVDTNAYRSTLLKLHAANNYL